ncbi:MAG: nucleotidyltransferase domain-containing protein [Nitrospinae bacterium]|nr:nucleotidyltransferase domain-containing protein [Nitrospinota bacterium]
MVDSSTIDGVKRFLKNVDANGIKVSFGVMFGSRARGDNDDQSDIDLIVVSPDFDGIKKRPDVAKLWGCAAETDARIEPIPCGEIQWREDDGSPIIEVARLEGQIVYPG